MSDPIQTSTPDTTPVSPDIALPNTVIHAPEPVVAAPEPVPVVTEPPAEYKINTLENGEREIVMNSGQVFRGTTDQVMDAMAKSVFHGTKRIAELGQQAPPQQTQPTGPTIDPTAKALADLTAQGMGFKNADDYMARLNQVEQYTQQQQTANMVAQFLTSTPEFPATEENGQKVDALVNQLGMTPSVESWKVAYNHLKATGQLVVNPAAAQQQRPAAMPLPPNGQAAPTDTPKGIWEMNDAEFKAYENKLRQGIQ